MKTLSLMLALFLTLSGQARAEVLSLSATEAAEELAGSRWAGAFHVEMGPSRTQEFPIEIRFQPRPAAPGRILYVFRKNVSRANAFEKDLFARFDVKDDGSCGVLPRELAFAGAGGEAQYGKIHARTCRHGQMAPARHALTFSTEIRAGGKRELKIVVSPVGGAAIVYLLRER